MEEEIEDNLVQDLDLRHWQPTEPVGLTASSELSPINRVEGMAS
jgi:hypothetical protein